MKIVPLYKNKIISLPHEIVSEKLSTATNDELKVLIAVFSRDEFTPSALADELEMTEKSFIRALNMWQDAGVLIYDSSDAKKTAKSASEPANRESTNPDVKKHSHASEIRTSLPHYASDELAEVMLRVKGASALLDSCQQTLGKIFNTAEASSIIAISEQLSLPNDYILLLCSYAASVDKKSVRYIEKLAIEFYDRDIVTYRALDEELNLIKARTSYETFVRKLFGIGRRALIKKEKEMITAWNERYAFPDEMIEKAYEITVSRTNEPKISYANAILENWYTAGIKTLEDVEAAEKEHEKKQGSSSFVTDDFYEAALKRSYESDNTNGGKK